MGNLLKFECALLLAVLVSSFRQPSFAYVTGVRAITQQPQTHQQAFNHFLSTDQNMIVFCDQQSAEWIWRHRNSSNTNVAVRSSEWLEEEWWGHSLLVHHPPDLVTVGRFIGNTLTFSKPPSLHESAVDLARMQLLHEALSYDIFDSEYLYWVDAYLMTYPMYSNEWKLDQFTRKHNLYHKIAKDFQHPFNLRTYHNNEIHSLLASSPKYGVDHHNNNIVYHASSQWFGGQKQAIKQVHSLYSTVLLAAFRNRNAVNSEIIFTVMLARYPHLLKPINILEPLAFWPFQLDNYHGPFETTLRHLSISQASPDSPFRYQEVLHQPTNPIYHTHHYEYNLFIDHRLALRIASTRFDKGSKFAVLMGVAIVTMRLLLWALKERTSGEKQISRLFIEE